MYYRQFLVSSLTTSAVQIVVKGKITFLNLFHFLLWIRLIS